ncbi:carboxymuconolactone decarboxylase family protein [Nocardia nepalensis]|uniref:carboxymuconolactone decarboxylase family protein n=1 Tax=Nocardia nepalensis TaxID=3375448 RepID=UPI003B671E9F
MSWRPHHERPGGQSSDSRSSEGGLAAITNGLTATEIAEVLLHTCAYAGVPTADTAFAIGQHVLAELGDDTAL